MKFLATETELLCLERSKWAEGFSFVAGIDEVGRGPLAGPVVAAAVVLPRDTPLPAVNDSKLLSEARRRELAAAIRELPGVDYGIAEVSVEEVDRLNILQATHLAMRLAVGKLRRADFLLIDGRPVRQMPGPTLAVVKGDRKSASIAAASILAKVYRDERMVRYGMEFPGYGFEEHKGYGTAQHLAALRRLGVTPIHRRSFAPVRELLATAEQLTLL